MEQIIGFAEIGKQAIRNLKAKLQGPAAKPLSSEDALAQHEREARQRGKPAYFDRVQAAAKEERKREGPFA